MFRFLIFFFKGQVGDGLFLRGNSNSFLEFTDYYATPKTYTISAWINEGEDASEPEVAH